MANADLSVELVDLSIRLEDAKRRYADMGLAAKGIRKEIRLIEGQISNVVTDIESGQMRLTPTKD